MQYYIIQMKNKDKIRYLDLVFPLSISNIFIIILYNILGGNIETYGLLTTFILMLVSFFVCYGLFSFFKDAHRIFYKMINDITKKIIKYYENN